MVLTYGDKFWAHQGPDWDSPSQPQKHAEEEGTRNSNYNENKSRL